MSNFKDISTCRITANNPCLIVVLMDRSGSMADEFSGTGISKATFLADSINDFLFNACMRCYGANSDMVKNKLHIALFGYSTTQEWGDGIVIEPAWSGKLKSQYYHVIGDILNNNDGEYDDGMPIWVKPHALGGTPMLAAFQNAALLIEDWIDYGTNRDSHPPILINITDGEASDDDISLAKVRMVAEKIRGLQTNYGETIVMNIHISSSSSPAVQFPNNSMELLGYSKSLYDLSSPLPGHLAALAVNEGFAISEGAKAFIYNGKASDLLSFITIGTSTDTRAEWSR